MFLILKARELWTVWTRVSKFYLLVCLLLHFAEFEFGSVEYIQLVEVLFEAAVQAQLWLLS